MGRGVSEDYYTFLSRFLKSKQKREERGDRCRVSRVGNLGRPDKVKKEGCVCNVIVRPEGFGGDL